MTANPRHEPGESATQRPRGVLIVDGPHRGQVVAVRPGMHRVTLPDPLDHAAFVGFDDYDRWLMAENTHTDYDISKYRYGNIVFPIGHTSGVEVHAIDEYLNDIFASAVRRELQRHGVTCESA